MPQINLLPWRETLKKEREIRFGVITGISLFFCGLIVLAVHLYMSGEINYQRDRNNYLNNEIKKAENKIKEIDRLEQQRQRMIERMSAIQELEESRPQIVHLFEEFVKQVPDGVYFTSLIQKGNEITLEGVAQSEARVSSLMTKFEKSQWLKNPRIIYIKKDDDKEQKRSVSNFKLKVTQDAPKKESNP